MPVESPTPWAAVILAAGTGARLGGRDKAAVEFRGRRLLDWALDAVADAGQVVVVGTVRPTRYPVRFTIEDPPGGGPAAGLLAGLDALIEDPELVAVLAVDMPQVTATTLSRLRTAVSDSDGAWLTRDGRRQLAGVFRASSLRAADPGPGTRTGLSIGALTGNLGVSTVEAVGSEGLDIDTWADLNR